MTGDEIKNALRSAVMGLTEEECAKLLDMLQAREDKEKGRG